MTAIEVERVDIDLPLEFPSPEPAPGADVAVTVALMVTRRCNMACAHCSVESGPRVKGQMDEHVLEQIIRHIGDSGAKAVLITGGEPMLREQTVLRLLKTAAKSGLGSALTTNGFWGKTPARARKTLAALKKAGLGFFTLSWDRFHLEFQGMEAGENILRAAEELGVPMNVNITRLADDSEIEDLTKPFMASAHPRVRFYDVQPVGRAASLPGSQLRAQVEGGCQGAAIPTVTDDGRMIACPGPSYFQKHSSPLVLGTLESASVADMVVKHRDDVILRTIRAFGPSRLKHELQLIAGFEDFPWKNSYSGMCELCLQINSAPQAANALRKHLSRPEKLAELAARERLMRAAGARGERDRQHSTGLGPARLWLGAARGLSGDAQLAWNDQAARVLGRADADWTCITEYLAGSGLARVGVEFAAEEGVRRWAPTMFEDRLMRHALFEARRELVQRAQLDTIERELANVGASGVLLKGAAFLALDRTSNGATRGSGRFPRRSAGDIDLLVPGDAARKLRDRLLELGWEGKRYAHTSGPHHLAAVSLSGAALEIHTRIMPRMWALPESEMLRHAQDIPGFSALKTLSPEGIILHSLVHCTAHLFDGGLKAAWDVEWIRERYPHIDWTLVGDWADQSAMPMSFYLPARVLRTALGLSISSDVLARVPYSPRFAALERLVRQRMFATFHNPQEINPFTKNGVFLALQTKWHSRFMQLASLLDRDSAEARDSGFALLSAQSGRSVPQVVIQQLRESQKHAELFRMFRKRAAEEVCEVEVFRETA
ncbi:MAG TPA: nucleotidyltransferase family protein [Gemmatimonadaceae bacterium]|nr:nucleotidyltransferase family protein [Gemmatimonadaceae bacterium]